MTLVRVASRARRGQSLTGERSRGDERRKTGKSQGIPFAGSAEKRRKEMGQ